MSNDSHDTIAFSVEDHPIPDELARKWDHWGDKIRRFGARYFDPDEGKPRKIGQMRVIKGNHRPSNDEMWAHILKVISRHAGSDEAQENPGANRYEALWYVRVGDGEKQKRHAIRLQRDDNGDIYFDDDDAHDPDGRESFYREQIATFERWAARQEAHAQLVQDNSVKHIGKLMDKLTGIAEQIGSVTGAAADSNRQAAKMMMGAAKMFTASHQKNSEQMRWQAMQAQIKQEGEERSQRMQTAVMAGAVAAPVVLQQLGYSPEQVAHLMGALGPMAAMVMGGGDGGGMPALPGAGAPSPMAQLRAAQKSDAGESAASEPASEEWTPGEKPPQPESDTSSSMRDGLAMWLHMTTDEQEIETRKIVGAYYYDKIRASAFADDETAREALREFWKAVTADPAQALSKATRLTEILGKKHGGTFVHFCQISATGLPLD